MILMLTKHPSYSFSCLTPYICVFCINDENETKIKQFRQQLTKLCNKEGVVAIINQYEKDIMQKTLGVIATTVATIEEFNQYSLSWSRPQSRPRHPL